MPCASSSHLWSSFQGAGTTAPNAAGPPNEMAEAGGLLRGGSGNGIWKEGARGVYFFEKTQGAMSMWLCALKAIAAQILYHPRMKPVHHTNVDLQKEYLSAQKPLDKGIPLALDTLTTGNIHLLAAETSEILRLTAVRRRCQPTLLRRRRPSGRAMPPSRPRARRRPRSTRRSRRRWPRTRRRMRWRRRLAGGAPRGRRDGEMRGQGGAGEICDKTGGERKMSAGRSIEPNPCCLLLDFP